MAITGTLVTGQMQFGVNGDVSLLAGVELVDDVLGRLAMRSVPITDPAIIAQVNSFVAQMLPSLSAQLGITVTVPPEA